MIYTSQNKERTYKMTDEPKILSFPAHKVVREIPEEHLKARQAKADMKLADTIVNDIVGIIITELDNCMVNVEDKQFSKDCILVVEALRASVYRQFGLEHYLHSFIDQNVHVISSEEQLSKEELQEKIADLIAQLTEAKETLLDKDDEE